MTFDEAAKLLKAAWKRTFRYPSHGDMETKWYGTYNDAVNDTNPIAFAYYGGRAACNKVEVPGEESTAVFKGMEAEYLMSRCGLPYGSTKVVTTEDDDEE